MLPRYACFSLIVLCALPFSARAELCFAPHPEVSIRTVFAPVEYDYSQSKEAFDPNTAGDMSGKMSIRFQSQTQQTGNCLALKRLDITIENTAKIRVSAAYRQGTCEFSIIKAHETRHLQVMQNFFNNLENYKSQILNQLAGKTSVPVANKDMLNTMLKDMLAKMKTTLGEQHLKLQYDYVDNPALVKNELAKCRNW